VWVIKHAYITVSGDPGLRRIPCCTVLHRDEVMVFVSNMSYIVVYPLVRYASEHRHISLHKGILICNTCLPVCELVCTLELEQG